MGLAVTASSFRPSIPRDPGPIDAMATTPDPCSRNLPDPRAHLERCWQEDCDIDPMILRMRLLRHLGALPHANSLEEELQPLF